MPAIDKYDTTDSHIRLLLQGEPGAWKTTTACQFPGVWVFDADRNLAGPLRYLRANNKPLPIGYDVLDRDDKDLMVPENLRWQRLFDCTNRVAKDAGTTGVQTLVYDSMSRLADLNKAHTLRMNPTKTGQFEQSSWLHYRNNWVQLVAAVTAARCHCVFIGHDKMDKNELDGSMKVMLNIQGQFGMEAGSFFTDVWHAELHAEGNPPKYRGMLRTMGDYRYHGLKNAFMLPPLFEFDWNLIQSKLTPAK